MFYPYLLYLLSGNMCLTWTPVHSLLASFLFVFLMLLFHKSHMGYSGIDFLEYCTIWKKKKQKIIITERFLKNCLEPQNIWSLPNAELVHTLKQIDTDLFIFCHQALHYIVPQRQPTHWPHYGHGCETDWIQIFSMYNSRFILLFFDIYSLYNHLRTATDLLTCLIP